MTSQPIYLLNVAFMYLNLSPLVLYNSHVSCLNTFFPLKNFAFQIKRGQTWAVATMCSWLLLCCSTDPSCSCRSLRSRVSVWTSCCLNSASFWTNTTWHRDSKGQQKNADRRWLSAGGHACCSRWALLFRTSSTWWQTAASSCSFTFLLLPCRTTTIPWFLGIQVSLLCAVKHTHLHRAAKHLEGTVGVNLRTRLAMLRQLEDTNIFFFFYYRKSYFPAFQGVDLELTLFLGTRVEQPSGQPTFTSGQELCTWS